MTIVCNGIDYPALHTDKYDFNDRILKPIIELFLKILDDYK